MVHVTVQVDPLDDELLELDDELLKLEDELLKLKDDALVDEEAVDELLDPPG